MNQNPILSQDPAADARESARFMSKVYMWMTTGIAISGAIAYAVSTDPETIAKIFSNRMMFWGLIIAQFGAVIVLSSMIKRLSALTATLIYLTYAALTGLTFSSIFLIYTMDSIVNVFAVTAFSFGGLSLVGATTKRDLGPVGSFCTMGLFGMVGFAVLGIFMPSMWSDLSQQVYSAVGIVVFAGLTAYDTQKIKAMNIIGNEGTEEDHKEAVMGALVLYLDFINLFLSILRLMGSRK